MENQGAAKRTLADGVLLWGTACLLIGLGALFFWVSGQMHVGGKWRLYLFLNLGFCAVMTWRFRTWFRHLQTALLLIAFLSAHLVVYGFLTRANLNLFLCVFLFPTEAILLEAIGEVARAKRREI